MFDANAKYANGDGASDGMAGLRDRMPPQNVEAEKGVIGSVLLDNSAMNEVAMILKPEDFFRDAHRTIYQAILAIYDAGKPFDLLIVAESLGGAYKSLGGDDTLADILGSVQHSANAAYYAGIVKQKAIGRALIEASNETLRECYSGDFTAEQLLESNERRAFAINESDANGDTVGAAEIVDLAMQRVATRENGEVSGVSTGFADADDMTDGLQPGNLVVVAARPGVGKTSYGLNVADYVSTAGGVATLFVSLEMNRAELGERLLSSRARIDNYRLKNPSEMTHRDRQALGQANGVLRSARLFIDDTPIRTVTQIAANARRIRSRHELGLIIVDYIQLIDGQRIRGESRQEEVARISKRLKGMARELAVPVMILAQLNRESEKRDDRRPRLADLRESGQIEADADVVVLLHRPEMYKPDDRPGEADFIVAKNRNGATGTVKLAYLKSYTRFETLDPTAGASTNF